MAIAAKTTRPARSHRRTRATGAITPSPVTNPQRPFWEIAVEISAQIPRDEWAKMPLDAAKRLDHYLYDDARDEA